LSVAIRIGNKPQGRICCHFLIRSRLFLCGSDSCSSREQNFPRENFGFQDRCNQTGLPIPSLFLRSRSRAQKPFRLPVSEVIDTLAMGLCASEKAFAAHFRTPLRQSILRQTYARLSAKCVYVWAMANSNQH